jgi:hypothetical protein
MPGHVQPRQEAGGVEDSTSLAAWLQEAGLVGQHDGLDAVAEVELGQYPPDMDLDGSLGQVHLDNANLHTPTVSALAAGNISQLGDACQADAAAP